MKAYVWLIIPFIMFVCSIGMTFFSMLILSSGDIHGYKVDLPVNTFSPSTFSVVSLETFIGKVFRNENISELEWIKPTSFFECEYSSGSYYAILSGLSGEYLNIDTGPLSAVYDIETPLMVVSAKNIFNIIELNRGYNHV